MKHKLLWTTISVAFLTEPEDRTEKQKGLAGHGLCYSVGEAMEPFGSVRAKGLLQKLNPHSDKSEYWLPAYSSWISQNQLGNHTRQHDLIRGDFAQLMACMSEKEFNLLTNWVG